MSRPRGERALLSLTGTRGARRTGYSALAIRLVAGTIFVVFGLGKFIAHRSESASFARYGLPHPSAFAFAIGVVELVFGSLLVMGFGTRIAALVLAGNLIGVIATAGRVEGGPVNLGLAPILLLAMLTLLRIGPGVRSLDRRLAQRLRQPDG